MKKKEPPGRPCAECGGVFQPIRMIDQAHMDGHRQLRYAAGDATPSFWTGGFPLSGTIEGEMCTHCGLVRLRGVPDLE
jgi:hypothetical protein